MEHDPFLPPAYCLHVDASGMASKSLQLNPWLLLLSLSLALLIMTGCQRVEDGKDLSPAEKEAQAVQIAADFAQDADLEQAQTRLHALDVPNAEQWLAMLAERYIHEGKDDAATDHLVALSMALGVKTATMARYATARFTATPVATHASTSAPEVSPTFTFTPVPPTATPTPVLPTPTPTVTPIPQAVVQADVLNVRSGPSTDYPIVGRLAAGDAVTITGQNAAGTWWQVCCAGEKSGWIYGALAESQGETGDVPVVRDVPPPPPTPTPLPPTATPVPQPQVDFRVASTRLLSIQENGGCVGMHNIFVTVIDAAGAPLDGIQVGRVWVPDDIKVTGADGKGPGRVVFDLFKHGDQVRVLNFSSETTRPLEVEDEKIPIPELIGAGYCPDEAECRRLINENRLCRYHYSWEVIFQRTW